MLIDKFWKVCACTMIFVLCLSGILWATNDPVQHDWVLICLIVFLHLNLVYELNLVKQSIKNPKETKPREMKTW